MEININIQVTKLEFPNSKVLMEINIKFQVTTYNAIKSLRTCMRKYIH